MNSGGRWRGFVLIAAALSCGGEDRTDVSPENGGMESSAGTSGAGGGGGEDTPDCFENPTNHFEIINACTQAVRVEKNPDLSLLEADGSLPPP